MLTGERCPLCDRPAATTVGPVYSGTVGPLWRRRTFEETLHRCEEGHIYSVRVEGEAVTTEPFGSVEEWLERKTGAHAPERPPGL